MKIVVNPFDKKSIDAAIAQVKQYKKDFEEKLEEFTRRLANIGVSVARTGFATADYDGVNEPIIVELQKTETGYNVVASGKTVGFIEFGTGRPERNPLWVDNNHVSEDPPYKPPDRGSYGKQQGLNPHGWWFNAHDGAVAQHTYGNPPAEAMLTARDEMVANIARIAREVWR